MVRKILFALLALGPLVVILDHAGLGDIELFVLSALALIPLAWLIGEATEHAAHHTGPGIGGFLNATFGNAPELIIALFAVHDGLTEVVRGSLTGSVVGNLLLVLGFSLAFGGDGELDRRSSFMGAGALLVFIGVALFAARLVPAFATVLGWPTARFGGASGQLAQGNARRNPQRTASTAAALMRRRSGPYARMNAYERTNTPNGPV